MTIFRLWLTKLFFVLKSFPKILFFKLTNGILHIVSKSNLIRFLQPINVGICFLFKLKYRTTESCTILIYKLISKRLFLKHPDLFQHFKSLYFNVTDHWTVFIMNLIIWKPEIVYYFYCNEMFVKSIVVTVVFFQYYIF